MTIHPRRRLKVFWAALAALFLLGAGEALAVVGRPATPVSYAGVARRSVRRAPY